MSETLKEQILQQAPVLEQNQQLPEEKTQAPSVEATQESEQEINWKKFRESRAKEREDAERQKQELEKKVREEKERVEVMRMAIEALKEKPSTQEKDVVAQMIDDLDPEEFPTGSQVKKMMEREIKKAVNETIRAQEEERQRQQQEQERKSWPQRVQQEIPDFHKYVNHDNLEYLEFHYPEVATPYAAMPDSKEKWSLIYKAVKRFVPNAEGSSRDAKKIEQNLNKPQSLNTISKAERTDISVEPPSRAQREANWARMQAVIQGRG